MKKIFLIFVICILAVSTSFANQLPRWSYFPLNVYIEPHPKKAIVEKAFATWQNQSGVAKFHYVDSETKHPNIIVKFVEKNPSNQGSQFENAVGVTFSYTPLKYYAKANITIYLTYPGSNTYMKDSELYSISLHEIGHSMGLIKHSSDIKDIMYPQLTDNTSLSPNDIKRLKYIYSP